MTQPLKKPRRAARVIRKNQLGNYTGNRPTQDYHLVKQLTALGVLHPYSMSPGGRSQVIDEDEVIALQDAVKAAGSLEALIAKLTAERKGGE
jgi:hypothetical protein